MASVNLLNYMDRFLMTILLEPIRLEFGLSDAQAGLLAGFGFALLYTLLALPAARIADRASRRRLLAGAIAFWSLMTGLCGTAGSFGILLVSRLGVGVGEAGVLPTMHSMISDMLPPHRRALAMSSLGVGATIGATLGFALGGWIGHAHGWRTAFLLATVPGLAISALVWFTLRDPPRGFADGMASAGAAPGFKEAMAILWHRRAYRYLVIGMSLAAVGFMGAEAWQSPFYIRVHRLTTAQVGAWMTLVHGIASVSGVLLGGWLSDRFYRYDRRSALWVICLSFGVTPLLSVFVYLARDAATSLSLLALCSVFGALWMGPFYAAQQSLAGIRYRATGSAIGMIGFNLIGSSLGPLLIGLASDRLRASCGIDALRYALLMVQIFFVIGLGFLLLAARTMRRDLAEAATL